MNAGRRGATAVSVALSIGVVFAFVALVVDLGMARVAQSQLQSATDVAALAGARLLDGTATGVEAASSAAVQVAGANVVLSEAVVVDAAAGVEFGRWDETTDSFLPESTPAEITAVRVFAQRDDLQTWFALFLGREQLATSAESIAFRGRSLGAGKVAWYLPFALPDCVTEMHPGEELSDITFALSPAGADTVGWGAVGTAPNAAWVRDHLDAVLECMHTWHETGSVSDSCATVSAGDTVDLGNGAQASSLRYLNDALERGIPWDTSRWSTLPARHPKSTVPPDVYGTVIEGPIPIFEGGPAYCTPTAGWTETFPVRGFVWGVIYDVAWKGKISQQNVWVRLDVSHVYDIGEWYGGENWGITYAGPPVLVR